MDDVEILALGRRAETMIRGLASITAEPGHITRLYLTPEHRRAADLVATWMEEAGLRVDEDMLGTVRGRLEPARGDGPPRRLLIGSHIDTVIDAGAYDGPLGVIAGILAADVVRRRHGALPIGVDVLAFGDEEGSRFPVALLCSNAVAGRFDAAALDVESVDGVVLRDALLAYGMDPSIPPSAPYAAGEALFYVEAHIEQGPVLEALGEPLGVVTAIAAQTRLTVTVVGEAGHAGTVPMPMRRDALAAAAEMVAALERIAAMHAADQMVGTVGRMTVAPGAPNVIPARVVFTVDLRSKSNAARDEALAGLRGEIDAIADRRRVTAWIERMHEAGATTCDADLGERLGAAIRPAGGAVPRLLSGAGHDGQAMAQLCPIGMLFVRCRGGVSHNPAEFVSVDDMGRTVAALVRFIEALAKA